MSHRQVTHWPAEVKNKTLWGKRPWTKLQVLFRSGLCRMGFPMSILIAVAVSRSEIQLTKNVRPLKGSRSQLHDVLWTELGDAIQTTLLILEIGLWCNSKLNDQIERIRESGQSWGRSTQAKPTLIQHNVSKAQRKGGWSSLPFYIHKHILQYIIWGGLLLGIDMAIPTVDGWLVRQSHIPVWLRRLSCTGCAFVPIPHHVINCNWGNSNWQ